jgi:hypothetical protein
MVMVYNGLVYRKSGQAKSANTLLETIEKPALLLPCDTVASEVLAGVL